MDDQAIVLANGSIDDPATLRKRLKEWGEAQVIAADGGSRHAEILGLDIDAVIGDLDSIDPETRAALIAAGVRIETSSPQKDETDLELALLNLADEKVKRIVVLGALGGRLDMTISNVLLLTHPRLASLQIELWQGRQTAWLIRPPGGEIRGREGDTLSLIPLDGDAQGITTYDLAYPLQHDTLSYGPARGVSNILSGPVARVDVHSGTLLAIHTAEAI